MRVSSTDLQNAFGKYLALVEKEDIIVVKNGKAVAKLIRYTEPDFFVVHEEAKGYRATRKISYEEYMELVNSSDQRYELIDGEVYLLASPSFQHQLVVNEIAWHFNNFFRGKTCLPLTAPLDIRLHGFAFKFEEDPNVVQPDIVVICDREKVSEDGKYEGIPTLIVEVLSPSTKTKRHDGQAKPLHEKRGFGVLDCHLDGRQILQYAFSQDRDVESLITVRTGETIRSAVFKDLEISLDDIFRDFAGKQA